MTALIKSTRSTNYLLLLLAAVLGLIVQIQITPEFGSTKVRLNLADPFIAIFVPLMLYVAVRNKSAVVTGIGKSVLALLGLATVVFSYAYAIGFWTTGFFTWAAVKYVGWYVLLSYFAAGVLLVAVLEGAGKRAFVFGFVFGNVIVVAMQLLLLILDVRGIVWSGARFHGFAGNPNAFGFILVCGLALCAMYTQEINNRLVRGGAELFSAMILAGLYFSGSIAAFLATTLVLGLLLMASFPWKKLLFIMVLSLVFIAMPRIFENIAPNESWTIENKLALSWAGAGADPNRAYTSMVGLRIDAIYQGFELWRQSPVFGVGLGTHLFEQHNKVAKGQAAAVQIHNTAIWLLAETGLVGVLTFVFLLVYLIRKIWWNAKAYGAAPAPPQNNFAIAAIICLLAWLLISLFHELMYQRVIWLIAGMAVWGGAQGVQSNEKTARQTP